MPFPDEYMVVLEDLGRAFIAYKTATSSEPVLVGGAATALGTAGTFMSADFDVVAAEDSAFADALCRSGFVAEGGLGHLAGGFYHKRFPGYVVEHVSGPLFDGRADRGRLIRLVIKTGSEIVIPSIEDLVADRLGQHAVASKSDDSRLRQASALFTMAEDIDRQYLARRIVEEGGDPALIGL